MSNDHIGVTFSTLRELAGDLEDILKQLNERLETLYGRTEKVVLTWEGEARDAFVDELDKWDRQMQDLQAAQAWLHEVVTTGHSNYAEAHRAVLRGWGAA
ncbi:WXG100 family type VII secretion target [Streptomyces sp. NBC_00264]|uniref:WXG100 family type VII secretion target n=1 Tax=unclassified Streptomyces TaxID=2593676 RepID=UPI0022512CD8|nr:MULTISPECIES: WXG100 family type VII secretion target [unclassified Streptomyces]WTB55956.1 WXG100 family type VII secretion target [Streptomyces sp. NBC_00826]WTH91162.1 WXG100 family type VII secretion target [Streptomyces sp. NBC_00825]WTH99888.1 WXG100 family type VII secretion target [Streptomyces sp. NBC_00822]MCX4394859.1 WXG100 family type VII secretion target [Streptomyces sp. NBC_01767]MCX4865359.1 WXG100 family type VII secretion target [Streptomyces sp. NBC_00906]